MSFGVAVYVPIDTCPIRERPHAALIAAAAVEKLRNFWQTRKLDKQLRLVNGAAFALSRFRAGSQILGAGCGRSRRYSSSTSVAPRSTAVPGVARTALTTPADPDRSSFSIFIASMTTRP